MFNQYKLWKISAYSTKPVKNFIRGTSSKDAKKKIYIAIHKGLFGKNFIVVFKGYKNGGDFLKRHLIFWAKKKKCNQASL